MCKPSSPFQSNFFFLILYILTSVYIFSLHFPRCWQGEFVKQSRASLVGEHFLYSHDPKVWFRNGSEGRNWILVTPRVNGAPSPSSVLERKLSTIYFSGQDVQAEFPFSLLLPFDETLKSFTGTYWGFYLLSLIVCQVPFIFAGTGA